MAGSWANIRNKINISEIVFKTDKNEEEELTIPDSSLFAIGFAFPSLSKIKVASGETDVSESVELPEWPRVLSTIEELKSRN